MELKCRCCGNEKLKSILSLGDSPLANNLLETKNSVDKLYPLEMMFCDKCSYCQLSVVVPPEILFDNYYYVSSTAKSFRDHFKQAAENYILKFNLTENSLVVDIGSNDGIALKPLKENGIKIVGVEPAKNIAKIANENGINTINSYFNESSVESILNTYGKADIITASNVFAHSAEIDDITKNAFKLLKDDGCFIVEVQYLLDTIKDLTFDNIYHEHVSYWSLTSLNNFFSIRGFTVVDVEHIDTHGGSIRVYIKNKGSIPKKSVEEYLKTENNFGINDYVTYKFFSDKVKNIKHNVKKNFDILKDKKLNVFGYGSPAKATTALNYFGIDSNYIKCIIEDNKLKHNKFLPGVKIPIISKTEIKSNPDAIVVMAWNFLNEIKKNNQDLINSGVKFISIKDLENSSISDKL